MLKMKYRKGLRIWQVFAGLMTVALCIGAVLYVYFHKDTLFGSKSDVSKEKPVAIKKAPQPRSISSNVLFLGNTYWGRYINDWSMASPLKYAYPFSRLNEFNRNQYDAWISGLECPTKSGVSMTSAEEDSTLTFNCSPEYLSEAAKWFTAFTLANNHTDNQGIDGFNETRQQLDKHSIQYFGHYDPRELNDICEVISLPVTVTRDDKTTVKGELPVAICGYHGVFRIPTDEAVAVMQKYSQYMPVIAMPHMGAEYKNAPDELKINFYRSLIDGGADMVIGDHPHWIQTSESYKGHLIVYSMGNFIFDQQDTPEVVRSAGIHMVMTIGKDNSELLSKWLALGETCQTFHDDCLDRAVKQKLSKLNAVYQFGVVGTNDSDKIVKPATAEQQASILERLHWQTTVSQLQPPYSGL
jgi:poly-gamma-glutamate synthesis protein (capsule biosynthesis protein)